jgi:hypothetical protein
MQTLLNGTAGSLPGCAVISKPCCSRLRGIFIESLMTPMPL